jgi:hypothetical protein
MCGFATRWDDAAWPPASSAPALWPWRRLTFDGLRGDRQLGTELLLPGSRG